MARTFHHSRKFGKYGWLRKGRPGSGYFHSHGATPSWHTRLFMNRPKRLADRAVLRHVAAGIVDADGAIFAVGCRKPHKYYW